MVLALLLPRVGNAAIVLDHGFAGGSTNLHMRSILVVPVGKNQAQADYLLQRARQMRGRHAGGLKATPVEMPAVENGDVARQSSLILNIERARSYRFRK